MMRDFRSFDIYHQGEKDNRKNRRVLEHHAGLASAPERGLTPFCHSLLIGARL